MNDAGETTQLNSCGCCDPELDDLVVENQPGQPALNYRIGTHATFVRRMLARLSKQDPPDDDGSNERPLASLTTRATDDPAIALLDGWATVADVLTFYQERIANEGFLRTAIERRSVLALARAIGYELNPGVAAGTHLAFTVDDSDQTPDETTVAAGTQIQSIPTKEGELPQTFETTEDFVAKAWWNALSPQVSTPQSVTLASQAIYLKGTNLNLAAGDRLLLVGKDKSGDVAAVRRRVRTVDVDREAGHTLVTFESEGTAVRDVADGGSTVVPSAAPAVSMTASIGFGAAFNETNLATLFNASLSESQFQAILKTSKWQTEDVLDYRKRAPKPTSLSDIQVFVLRESAGIFGHNAPHYDTLSTEAQAAFHDWDTAAGWEIWKDSIKPDPVTVDYYTDPDLYLERPISGIIEDDWLLLERRNAYEVYKVADATEGSLAGFGISAKVVGLELTDVNGNSLEDKDKPSEFKVRKTTAYVVSEELTVAPVPITTDFSVGETKLPLDELVLGLQVGQPIALTGEQADASGVTRNEIKFLEAITHSGGLTTLTFSEGLAYNYKRDTVTVNANVVRATHGETVAGEALGSGDGAAPHQRFKLKQPPLTYVSAATATGSESTLSVRVNGVEWQEALSLYGLNGKARNYIVRINDDSDAFVTFGDGKSGARLPTGQENIVATYRSGIGSVGEVDASTLTLMKKRPFGVRSVTNPIAASGADDPERLDDARTNAPLTVLTLDRIVSLQDFEDFARAFAGIGKAKAVALWRGETELVHITIADANGDQIADTADLFGNLRDAINAARDPLRAVVLGSFQPRFFELEARVLIDQAYLWEDVKVAIEDALVAAFGFTARSFGQPASSAEILNIVHDIVGVVAVDLEKFYVIDDAGQPVGELLSSVLSAQNARPNPDPLTVQVQRFLPAELLLINEAGITLTEMES